MAGLLVLVATLTAFRDAFGKRFVGVDVSEGGPVGLCVLTV